MAKSKSRILLMHKTGWGVIDRFHVYRDRPLSDILENGIDTRVVRKMSRGVISLFNDTVTETLIRRKIVVYPDAIDSTWAVAPVDECTDADLEPFADAVNKLMA